MADGGGGELGLEVALEVQALDAIFGEDFKLRRGRALLEAALEAGGMGDDLGLSSDLAVGDGADEGSGSSAGAVAAASAADDELAGAEVAVQLLPNPGEGRSENHVGLLLHFVLPPGYLEESTAVPHVEVAPGSLRRVPKIDLEDTAAMQKQEAEDLASGTSGTFGFVEDGGGGAANSSVLEKCLEVARASMQEDCAAGVSAVYNACAAVKEVLEANNISMLQRRSAAREAEAQARLDKRLAGTEVTAASFTAWADKWYAAHPELDPLLDDEIADGATGEKKLTGRQMFEAGAAAELGDADDPQEAAEDASPSGDAAGDGGKAAAPAAGVDWDLFDDADAVDEDDDGDDAAGDA